MPWEAWFTLILAVATVATMARSSVAPDGPLVLSALAIAVASIVSGRQHGGHALLPNIEDVAVLLGSPILWSVAALFVVAKGLGETGAADRLAGPILGSGTPHGEVGKRTASPLLRATAPLLAIAPFLSNTTIMAILLPVTTDWCRRHRVSPSKLLLPLNYIKMLGAMCCILGTTANLVVAALIDKSTIPGLHTLGLFEIAWVGLPCAFAGVAYIVLFGVNLLPDRKPGVSDTADIREYTVSVCVEPGGPLDGKSIADAGLRSLPGLYLVEIERGDELIAAVGPTVGLRGDDRLTFVGALDSVVDLRKMRGLQSEDRQREKLSVPPPGAGNPLGATAAKSQGAHERVLIEAVVSSECPLVGKSVRDGKFRAHYGAAIIAIARGAQRLTGKIGDVVLQVGDTLVLEARPAFLERVRRSRDFFLATKVEGFSAPKHDRAFVAMGIMGAMVLATSLFKVPFFLATLTAAAAMVVTGCLGLSVARSAVEWRVVLAIGASFALGDAMRTSGAAQGVADTLIKGIGNQPRLALACVFGMTALATELITHTAAATLMFPLAMAAAARLGVSPMPFAVIVLVGASCSFATPFGYQTNLMIMGPGGYRFKDYVRFGSPLTAIVGTVAVTLTPLVWHFV
jgi:di/tricarboxylate transporter